LLTMRVGVRAQSSAHYCNPGPAGQWPQLQGRPRLPGRLPRPILPHLNVDPFRRRPNVPSMTQLPPLRTVRDTPAAVGPIGAPTPYPPPGPPPLDLPGVPTP